jgi:hypothetical protein
MAKEHVAAGLRAIVSNHINSIADAFCSLGGESAPDFVLGLTTLDEAFAFSSRSCSRQWVVFLRQHKLLSSEGAPPFKIFEHNLARPGDVFQLTSITPAAAAGIWRCACGGNCRDVASADFEAACNQALSRSGPNADAENQSPYISLAQVDALPVILLGLIVSLLRSFQPPCARWPSDASVRFRSSASPAPAAMKRRCLRCCSTCKLLTTCMFSAAAACAAS